LPDDIQTITLPSAASIRFNGRKRSEVENKLEISIMTIKLSTFTASFIGAFALIGASVAAPIGPANVSNDVTGSIGTQVSTSDSPFHVYCFNGVSRDGNNQHRGWVCQQETSGHIVRQ
jgi:hypothetical protein